MATEKPNVYFIEPNDIGIKPTQPWQKTDKPHATEGPGCPLNCIYCNQQFLDTDRETGDKLGGVIEYGVDGGVAINDRVMIGPSEVLRAEPHRIVTLLAESKYYDPNMAIIIRNFTDPGLNWPSSIAIAKLIDEKAGHVGPTVFITKMSTKPEHAEQMKEYQQAGGKPVIMVTYSGLPPEIEPASSAQRINTMRQFHEAGIPVIVSMRPMIEGINTSTESITQVIHQTHEYADLYIVGGLYVYPGTADLFQSVGHDLPAMYKNDGYPIAKILNPQTRQKVREIAKQVDPKTIIYDHASCATAAIATTFYDFPSYDPLPHWSTPAGLDFDNCAKFCLPDQMAQCKNKLGPEAQTQVLQKARQVLDRIGHADKGLEISEHQEGMFLVKDGILTFQELITLTRETGWRADNLPNREGMLYRLSQAFNDNLKQDLSKLQGVVQVGQQWYLFVDGKIDGTFNNVNTLRFSRSATRSRIPRIFDVNELTPEMTSDIATLIAVESKRSDEIATVKAQIDQIIIK